MSVEEQAFLMEAEKLGRHPRFAEAVTLYTRGVASHRQGPRFLNKLIAQNTRWRVIGYLLYLHYGRDPEISDSGASYARLSEICEKMQDVSPRVLKTMLALLNLAGFVRVEHSARDRRLKLYRPTEKMIGFITLFLAGCFAALDLLEPEQRRVERHLASDELLRRYLLEGGRQWLSGETLTHHVPQLFLFFHRDGGFSVLSAMMQAYFEQAGAPTRSELAKRYGMSKSQVDKLVGEALSNGLFLNSDGAPTRLLLNSYMRWVSIELAYHARHTRLV